MRSEQELQDYARWLLLEQAREEDFVGILELAEDYRDGALDPISDDDAHRVSELMSSAVMTITFPDASEVTV
jgi:hypothetical protein